MKKIFSLLLFMLTVLTVSAQLPSGYVPCAVSGMQGEWQQVGDKNNVVLTFTTPTQATKYDMSKQDYVYTDIEGDLTKIVIQRITNNFTTITKIGEIESPAKGASLSFTDEDLQFGSYMYRVLVYVGSISSSEWDWDAIKTVVVGQIPADFEDEDVSAVVEGNKVTLKYKTPTLSSIGAPLTMDMNCVISEMTGNEPPTYVDLHTEQNVTPGGEYTYVIENAKNGIHTYCLQAVTASGASNGTYRYCINVFIGRDVPGPVVSAYALVEKDGVYVSWQVPAHGQNGGDMGDTSQFTYTVIRKTSLFDPAGTVIASDIQRTFVDDKDVSEMEGVFLYEIIAKNEVGEGTGVLTNSVLVGKPAPLPFAETFERKDEYNNFTFDHTWLKTYSGSYSSWYVTGGTFYINEDNPAVTAHGGEGMAYAMYSSWGETDKSDKIQSSYIDFTESSYPVLSFWMYDVATGQARMMLNIMSVNDGTSMLSDTYPLGQAEENGWTKITVALEHLRNIPSGQVALDVEAHGANCFPVVIDDILVEDNEEVYTSITALGADKQATTDCRMYNLRGQQVTADYKGIVIVGGKKYIRK